MLQLSTYFTSKELATALLEMRAGKVQQAESWRLVAGFEMFTSGHPSAGSMVGPAGDA